MRVPAAMVLVMLAATSATAQTSAISPPTVEALERWTTAVTSHVPGQVDAPVRAVWAMTIEDRRALNPGMTLFLTAITGGRFSGKSLSEQKIVDLAAELARRPGAAEFLKRGAVLHGDAAMAGYQLPVVHPVPPGASNWVTVMTAPLITERRLYLENDGQVVGMTIADWNWAFARSLLSQRLVDGDPFAGQWYHATAAFMFRNRIFGEVQEHVDHAAVRLPDDPRILLDRGSAAEHQGLPRSQNVLSDGDRLAAGIQSLGIANGNAERFFRRAVQRDPRLFEARIRLARLLSLRARYAEALSVITEAPAGTAPDHTAEYFAHLFAARAEQALGRLDAAAARLRQARALFPDAQSVLMAASHLALIRDDEDGAEERMDHLAFLPYTRGPEDDPWWVYGTFTGRYADALIAAMWKDAGG